MKKSLIIFLVMFSSFSCKEDPVSPTYTPVFSNDLFTVDTLQITVGYDDTPGFLSPTMYHDIYVVTRLSKSALVNGYTYQSGSTVLGMIFSGSDSPENFVHRLKRRVWSRDILIPGTAFNYVLTISASFEEGSSSITLNGNGLVTHAVGMPQTESGAQQLTEDTLWSHSPCYSSDGKWIYYLKTGFGSDKTAIYRIPSIGGAEEKIFERNSFLSFSLMYSDSVLLVLTDEMSQKSKLIFVNLYSHAIDSTNTNGYLWHTPLYCIPSKNSLLTSTDPNVNAELKSSLVLVNIATGAVDTLYRANGETLPTSNYSVRPGTNHISFTSTNDYKTMTVHLYDMLTKSESIFSTHIIGHAFFWAPNGTDYASIRRLEERDIFGEPIDNIYFNRTGIDRRVTTYPGTDWSMAFSPTEQYIAMSSIRRNDYQVWRIPYK